MQQKLNTVKNKKRTKKALDVNHKRAKQKRRVEFEIKLNIPENRKKNKNRQGTSEKKYSF